MNTFYKIHNILFYLINFTSRTTNKTPLPSASPCRVPICLPPPRLSAVIFSFFVLLHGLRRRPERRPLGERRQVGERLRRYQDDQRRDRWRQLFHVSIAGFAAEPRPVTTGSLVTTLQVLRYVSDIVAFIIVRRSFRLWYWTFQTVLTKTSVASLLLLVLVFRSSQLLRTLDADDDDDHTAPATPAVIPTIDNAHEDKHKEKAHGDWIVSLAPDPRYDSP